MASDLINYVLDKEASIKHPNLKSLESFWVGKHTHKLGGSTPREEMDAPYPFSKACPMHLFHLAISELPPL